MEEGIRRESPCPGSTSLDERAELASETETHVYLLAFLRTQKLTATAKALVKELNKQPYQAPGLAPLTGDVADVEAAKCTGLEVSTLVRAKIEMAKEMCVVETITFLSVGSPGADRRLFVPFRSAFFARLSSQLPTSTCPLTFDKTGKPRRVRPLLPA